jgi:ketosteroid isomerase-like protein
MATRSVPAATGIRQLDKAFMSALNRKDAAALVKGFYAPDAVLMPPNHEAVKGRPHIQRFLQGLIDAGAADFTLKTTKIESAGPLAYGRGVYGFSLPAPDGSRVRNAGKYVVVYRRQRDGTWKAVADIFNSDHPAGAIS